MAEQGPQNFQNHARLIPAYHFFVFGVFAIHFLYAAYYLIRWFSFGSLVNALVAAALVVFFFYARIFALTAQDRIIRLEERLRMEQLLPDDLKRRIGELQPGQLIALRFAGDDELPQLTRQVLDEKISDRAEIKRRIKSWRADYLRV